MSDTSPRVICLWCHPRSTSTMFERAFLNKPNFRVLHEPMGDAWYFGSQRVSPRYSKEKCAADFGQYANSTFESVWQDIVKHDKDTDRTFVKDMAQYYMIPSTHADTAPSLPEVGNPTLLPSKVLLHDDIQHTFLIRSPAKAVPSYYRLCSGEHRDITGFQYFDPEECGMAELKQLYDFVVAAGRTPLVIDSQDLITQPEKVMQAFCENTGVSWDPAMLEWKSEAQSHFEKWPGWHTDAEQSTGIQQRTNTADTCDWPKVVNDTIAANMADYEWLRERRLRVD